MKPVLDACCGPRLFWFDHNDPRAVFVDNRAGEWTFKSSAYKSGVEAVVIAPDMIADFRDLPFPDEYFSLVVFDPPHLIKHGSTGILIATYGRLTGDWQETIRVGFKECFRVLKPYGTLIFKWAETDVPVSQILKLTPERPLIGNRCGKKAKSHWLVFLKSNEHQPTV